ncbi:glycosyltransferase [Vibrio sp. DNB22_19_2]
MINVAFILDHPLMDYRIPFFEKLAELNLNLTVIHTGDTRALNGVSEVISKNIKAGKFFYRTLPDLSAFDVVICMQNIRMINLWTMSLNPFKKYRLYHWGIGLSSSKGLINQNKFMLFLRFFLTIFAKKLFLYSDYPRTTYPLFLRRKLLNVNNTVYNPNPINTSGLQKDSFLFIGSLNKRKGIEELISAYYHYAINQFNPLRLVIVGDGNTEYKKQLLELVKRLELQDYVEFKGKISSLEIKKSLFSNAVACLSLKQAGLSVLESFSYGVPFVSYRSAISGGEHLHVSNGFNGYLVNDEMEASKVMAKLHNEPCHSSYLGLNSYYYYLESCTMDNMVEVFFSEIGKTN